MQYRLWLLCQEGKHVNSVEGAAQRLWHILLLLEPENYLMALQWLQGTASRIRLVCLVYQATPIPLAYWNAFPYCLHNFQ